MLKVNNNYDIKLTRGDTARFMVNITNDITGRPYEIAQDDTVIMTIKKTVDTNSVAIQKTNVGTGHIVLNPADTKLLNYGSYVYDVELRTASGDVYTVIGPSAFELTKEVTT